ALERGARAHVDGGLAQLLTHDAWVGRLPVGLEDEGTARARHLGQRPETDRYCRSRSRNSLAQGRFELQLPSAVGRRKPSAAGERSGFEVDDEVAVPSDQDRDRHRREPAAVLEGLELVQLEGVVDSPAFLGSLEHPAVEEPAMPPEEFQSSSDCSARAVEDAGGLAVGDVGGEVAKELEVEARQPEPVVEPEGLHGKSSKTVAAAETLDGAAVALSAEMSVQAESETST